MEDTQNIKKYKAAGLKLFFVVCLVFSNSLIFSQITREEYIQTYKAIAIAEMHRTGIPASITMAQALLESNNGNSKLARRAKNHFGIKCHSSWTGKTYHKTDDKRHECFRKYSSVEESYKDHSGFLQKKRYADLFKLTPDDYKGWARGLKKAGYATNPKYSALLISIIEENKLYELDKPQKKNTIKEKESIAEKKTVVEEKNTGKKEGNDKGITNNNKIEIASNSHQILINNRVKYIVARENDTFESLNKEFDLMTWQLPKYNELPADATLKEGQLLYLQPKRNKAETGKMEHIVEKGEDLYFISQKYAIKLKKLLKWNNLNKDSQIKEGDKIFLRNPK